MPQPRPRPNMQALLIASANDVLLDKCGLSPSDLERCRAVFQLHYNGALSEDLDSVVRAGQKDHKDRNACDEISLSGPSTLCSLPGTGRYMCAGWRYRLAVWLLDRLGVRTEDRTAPHEGNFTTRRGWAFKGGAAMLWFDEDYS